jgi:hypothetical protein
LVELRSTNIGHRFRKIDSRWEDESNGEIYTEPVDGRSVDVDVANPLYVVENGREYRLVPLRQRRQLFERTAGKEEAEAAEAAARYQGCQMVLLLHICNTKNPN